MPIVLPEPPDIRAVRRKGNVYVNVYDLVAYFYKAAADPEQNKTSAETFRMLAEELEEVSRA